MVMYSALTATSTRLRKLPARCWNLAARDSFADHPQERQLGQFNPESSVQPKVWRMLCAQVHSHVERGKGRPQTVATSL